MKVVAFILFVLIATVVAEVPPGVVENIYTQKGLQNHYISLFNHAESTFGDHDMGTESAVYGWWIFGTGMTIKNTKLDNYDLGKIDGINFADMTYEFTHSQITGTLAYKWTYRWFIIPFSHSAECKFTVNTHIITTKFDQKGDQFSMERDVQYTQGEPTIDCTDGDQTQNSHWGFEWMTEVRENYKKNLGDNLKKALVSWLDSVDTLFNTANSANFADQTYGMKSHLKEAKPDPQANLMLGYNYDISLKSSSRSPVPHENLNNYELMGDVSTFFFEEYFQSLLELEKEAVNFYVAVTSKNVPANIGFQMKASDFLYIIDGIEDYDRNSNMEADCSFGTDSPTVNIDTQVYVGIPVYCILKVEAKSILEARFNIQVKGIVQVNPQGAIELRDEEYQVTNFTSYNKIGNRVLDDYLIRRVQAYAIATNFADNIQYFDNQFNGMINLSAMGGKQFIRVSGEISPK